MLKVLMAANGSESEFESWLKAQSLSYSVLKGCYKGQTETSFQIEISAYQLKYLVEKAIEYKQESILFIDLDQRAHLIFMSNRKNQALGMWQVVNKELAINQDAYSFNPLTNEYYLAA